MKSLRFLPVLVAVCVLAAPAALAQRLPHETDSGVPGWIPHPGIGGNIVARVFTSALLTDSTGAAVGKAKTATIQTTSEVVQGLRVQVQGTTPNTEYALVIDNNLIGTSVSSETGILKMRFVSPTGGRVPPLPESVLPIATARSVAIYEVSSQRLVASGQLSAGTGPK